MTRAASRALPAALLLCSVAAGYIRLTDSGVVTGAPLRRGDAESVAFLVQDTVEPGLRNADGRFWITPTSDPLAALQAAVSAWNGIEGSSLAFEPVERTSAANDPNDGRNVFVFDDTPAMRAILDNSLAVTRHTFDADGVISDTDILFNPDFTPGNNQVPFSTDLASNTYDLQSIATHQLGRALGLTSSPVLGSPMYPFPESAQPFGRRLSTDDRAFARDVYPSEQSIPTGVLTGTVSVDGEPGTGVLVTAVDVENGVLITALSSLVDGTYRMTVPAESGRRYFVYAEPLDGPFRAVDLQLLNLEAFRIDARPSFVGSNPSPTRLTVSPGRVVRANPSMEGGPAALEIERIGIDEPGASGRPPRLAAGPIVLTAGGAADIVLVGRGIDESIGLSDIRLLGPGLSIREGSVRVDPDFLFEGGPVVRATVDVELRSERRLGSVVVVKDRAADVLTGALIIEPPNPAFAADDVRSGASFESGAVAPGEIVSVFGAALGPAEGFAVDELDPATGRLPREAGDAAALFDGEAAPLFFVSGEQVNLQTPFELAERASTTLQMRYGGIESEAVTLDVTAARPALFTFADGRRAVALNQDGSVNGPDNPARRGEFVTLFGTGQGVVDPPIPTGAPAPTTPLSRIPGASVSIGGAAVEGEDLFFAGMTPGLVGVFQLNARVPLGATPGESPLTVAVRGATSPPGVILWVE